MYEIIVKGKASTDCPKLKELDGIDCQDNFSEYFDTDFTFKDVVTGGYMEFSYENGDLWTLTIYESSRELSKDELNELEEYTSGQWSDGIGEVFEQIPVIVDDEEVFISPWCPEQKTTITQKQL